MLNFRVAGVAQTLFYGVSSSSAVAFSSSW